jgi:hypothetical protein
MSHLHLCCLDLVDERGQPGGVEYVPDVDSGPADNEIAAAILACGAAIFQPAASSGSCDLSGHRCQAETARIVGIGGAEVGSRTILRVTV